MPEEPNSPVTPFDSATIADLYRHPAEGAGAHVRANMITSLDGAATVEGRSGGLGSAGDRQIFTALRAAADVVLVGAGTVRAEGYHTPEHPALAIITGGGLALTDELTPASGARPYVFTPDGAGAHLRAAGARVIEAPSDRVDLAWVVATLASLGLPRVLTEGGPGLLAQLVAAGLVDELCLTLAPVLVGGDGPRMLHGSAARPGRWHRAHLLGDDQGYLYGRWLSLG